MSLTIRYTQSFQYHQARMSSYVIIKPVKEQLSENAYVTTVNEEVFTRCKGKLKRSKSESTTREFTIVRYYTEDFHIVKDGLPRCVSHTCTDMKIHGEFISYTEKEVRLHNSNFTCRDNFQSIVHVDQETFHHQKGCDIVFEKRVNEQKKTHFSIYMRIRSGQNITSFISRFENILKV